MKRSANLENTIHFDRNAEFRRLKKEQRDTVRYKGDGKFEIKPINEVVHQRMARRPFVPFAEFDTDAFVDYGRKYYDNNRGIDRRSRTFRVQERLAAKRAKVEAIERKKEQRRLAIAARKDRSRKRR